MSNSTEPAVAANPVELRAFQFEFRNAWQTRRFIVIAPDIESATSTAGQFMDPISALIEYPYRLTSVQELDGDVLGAPGVTLSVGEPDLGQG